MNTCLMEMHLLLYIIGILSITSITECCDWDISIHKIDDWCDNYECNCPRNLISNNQDPLALNLADLQGDATTKCIKKKGVCIPDQYCQGVNGTVIQNECKYSQHVCCQVDVTEELFQNFAPLIKDTTHHLKSFDSIELRSRCEVRGLLSHYCISPTAKCKEPTANIGFDFYEWKIEAINKGNMEEIKSGDIIVIGVDDKYLKCYHNKCTIKECRSDQGHSQGWSKNVCKRSTFKIYAPERHGNCSFNVTDDCTGETIHQGDDIVLSSLSKPGFCVTNDDTKSALKDVTLTNCNFETSENNCNRNKWALQILSRITKRHSSNCKCHCKDHYGK